MYYWRCSSCGQLINGTHFCPGPNTTTWPQDYRVDNMNVQPNNTINSWHRAYKCNCGGEFDSPMDIAIKDGGGKACPFCGKKMFEKKEADK